MVSLISKGNFLSHEAFLKVWSNFAFLIPVLIALHFSMYTYASLVFVTMIASILYHASNEKSFKALDVFFAHLLIVSNLYLCYLFNFQYPYFHIAFVFVFIAFFFFFLQHYSDKAFNHAMWHMASVVITSSCILGFGILIG